MQGITMLLSKKDGIGKNISYKIAFKSILFLCTLFGISRPFLYLALHNTDLGAYTIFVNFFPTLILFVALFITQSGNYKVATNIIMFIFPLSLALVVLHQNDILNLYFINIICILSFVVFIKKRKSYLSYIYNASIIGFVYLFVEIKSLTYIEEKLFAFGNIFLLFVIQFLICNISKNIYFNLFKKLKKENTNLNGKNENLQHLYKSLVAKNIILEKQQINFNAENNIQKVHRFLSIISHDVKAPLISIKNIFDYTKEDTSHQQIVEFIPEIGKTINNTVSLLENLLEWSKNSNNLETGHNEQIRLQPFINQILELYAVTIKSKNLLLEIECDPTLRLFYNKDVLHTVIRNLISNAVKYTPENGNIIITSFKINNQLFLKISNTAYCVNDKQIHFLNCNANTPVKSLQLEVGSGLGLMIVKDFLYRNNASIKFANDCDTFITCTVSFDLGNSRVLKSIQSNTNAIA